MLRAGFAGLILGLVMLSTGCRMCAHPFDYCGPTFLGEGPCCPDEPRAGSITAAGAIPVPDPATSVEPGELDYRMEGSGDVTFLEEVPDANLVLPHDVVESPTPAVVDSQDVFSDDVVIEPSPTVNETPGWTPSRRTAARQATGPRLRSLTR